MSVSLRLSDFFIIDVSLFASDSGEDHFNNHCSPSSRSFQPSLERKRQVHSISTIMENYRVLGALGSGTWGVVHSAEQNGTGRKVAIKKIKSERSEEGVNFTAIREIKLLREFKHPNIIELVDVFSTPDMAICLVYEIAETDLEKILNNKQISISLADIKQHLFSLLNAISACHDRWILHRDLKPDNMYVIFVCDKN